VLRQYPLNMEVPTLSPRKTKMVKRSQVSRRRGGGKKKAQEDHQERPLLYAQCDKRTKASTFPELLERERKIEDALLV